MRYNSLTHKRIGCIHQQEFHINYYISFLKRSIFLLWMINKWSLLYEFWHLLYMTLISSESCLLAVSNELLTFNIFILFKCVKTRKLRENLICQEKEICIFNHGTYFQISSKLKRIAKCHGEPTYTDDSYMYPNHAYRTMKVSMKK